MELAASGGVALARIIPGAAARSEPKASGDQN
jgi:hypothetical protein